MEESLDRSRERASRFWELSAPLAQQRPRSPLALRSTYRQRLCYSSSCLLQHHLQLRKTCNVIIMGFSNEVTTDENGYFRHQQGYPLVVIFDSKDVRPKSTGELSWQDPFMPPQPRKSREDVGRSQLRSGKANPQPLKFVNTCNSVGYDRGIRRAIRSHVIQDRQRRKRGRQTSADELLIESAPSHAITSKTKTFGSILKHDRDTHAISSVRQPFMSLDSFIEFPVNMEPYMYSLIQRYLFATSTFVEATKIDYSPQVNQQRWFTLALTDAALFHCILCGSALFSDRYLGRMDSPERSKHMNEAIRLLNAKLQVPGNALADSTLVAVAHLAEFECMMGDFAKWKLHLDGLHKMVEVRGGFQTLSDSLKSKLWRAEVSGCTSTLSKPRFTPPASPDISVPSAPEQPFTRLCCGLQGFAESLKSHEDFVKLLVQLQDLAALLNNPAEQNFMNTFRILALCQSDLFSLQTSHKYNPVMGNNNLVELCSLAVMLYLKIVFDSRLRQQGLEIHAPIAPNTRVLQQFKTYIESMDVTTDEVKALVLWTLFLGGVAVAGTKERAWFVARLVKWTMEWNIRTWQEAELVLIDFLWVEKIHGSPCKELWEEVVVTRKVLFEITV